MYLCYIIIYLVVYLVGNLLNYELIDRMMCENKELQINFRNEVSL